VTLGGAPLQEKKKKKKKQNIALDPNTASGGIKRQQGAGKRVMETTLEQTPPGKGQRQSGTQSGAVRKPEGGKKPKNRGFGVKKPFLEKTKKAKESEETRRV